MLWECVARLINFLVINVSMNFGFDIWKWYVQIYIEKYFDDMINVTRSLHIIIDKLVMK